MKTLRLVRVYDDWDKKETIGIYEVETSDEGLPVSRGTSPVRIEWDVDEEEDAIVFLTWIQQAFIQPVLEDDDFVSVVPF